MLWFGVLFRVSCLETAHSDLRGPLSLLSVPGKGEETPISRSREVLPSGWVVCVVYVLFMKRGARRSKQISLFSTVQSYADSPLVSHIYPTSSPSIAALASHFSGARRCHDPLCNLHQAIAGSTCSNMASCSADTGIRDDIRAQIWVTLRLWKAAILPLGSATIPSCLGAAHGNCVAPCTPSDVEMSATPIATSPH